MITYAGQPLILVTDELEKHINKNMPIKDTLLPPRQHPLKLSGLSFPLSQAPRSKIELNVLRYPTWGATRWAEFWGVVDKATLEAIEEECFVSSNTIPQTLKLGFGEGAVSTPMFLLPPIPLTTADNTNNLHLITLVDARYYLGLRSVKELVDDDFESWSSLLSAIQSDAGITISPISSGIGTPADYSDLVSMKGAESVAFILDAIASNMGCRFIRKFDGTYAISSAATCQSNFGTNESTFSSYGTRSGGKSLSTSSRKAAVVPEKVAVTFPRWSSLKNDYMYKSLKASRHPINHVKDWVETVTVSESNRQTGLTKVFHCTAKAYWTTETDSGSPTNASAITSLVSSIAAAYVAFKTTAGAGVDMTFNNILKWTPDGAVDIEWKYTAKDCYTRVTGCQWNEEVEELLYSLEVPDFCEYEATQYFGKATTEISARSSASAIPGSGTVQIWKLPLTGTVTSTVTTMATVTAYNFNTAAISSGKYVRIFKDPFSCKWIVEPLQCEGA